MCTYCKRYQVLALGKCYDNLLLFFKLWSSSNYLPQHSLILGTDEYLKGGTQYFQISEEQPVRETELEFLHGVGLHCCCFSFH